MEHWRLRQELEFAEIVDKIQCFGWDTSADFKPIDINAMPHAVGHAFGCLPSVLRAAS